MSITETSFYIAGGTLRTDAPSYVERQADTDLLQALRGGEYCYVLNTRQIGKSSLMVRTATRLREEGVRVAILDLTSFGQNLNPEQWYKGLLGKLSEHMSLEDEIAEFCDANPGLSPMQKLMESIYTVALTNDSSPIVIFIDEIDTVRSLPFSADELFAAIRECYNRRAQDLKYTRISFCLLGVASPADLVSDTRVGPFNVGRRIHIRDFSAEEAIPLAEGLKKRGFPSSVLKSNGHGPSGGRNGVLRGRQDVPDEESETGVRLLRSVLYWTGGHPYMTQRLCRAVAEDPSARSPEDVDRLCAALFFSSSTRGMDDNLAFVRNRLLRSDADLSGLLELYSKVCAGERVAEDETNPLKSILLLSGIVRAEGGLLQVRNRIYSKVFDQRWVNAHMPDADLRRQRAAYWRGVARTAVLFGTIVAAMALVVINSRQAQWRVSKALATVRIAEANERAERLRAQGLLYYADMGNAQRAWDEGNSGRVKELLYIHARPGAIDVPRGFEWGYLWKLTHAAKYTLRGHTGGVRAVTFSPDGRLVATGSYDHMVRIWDINSGTEVYTPLGHPYEVYAVSFSPDGKTLATGTGIDGSIRLWDTSTWRQTRIVRAHHRETDCLAYSRDGKLLASGGDEGPVKVWDAKTLALLGTMRGHDGFVWSVSFAPDGKTLASGGQDNSVRLWPLRAKTDGKSKSPRIVDIAGGRLLPDKSSIVKSVSFSPDGSALAVSRFDNIAQIWNPSTNKLTHTLRGHKNFVISLAYSGDGKFLTTASYDGTAALWDTKKYAQVKWFKGHNKGILSAALSGDGRILVTGSEDCSKVWDTSAPANPDTLVAGSAVWSVVVTQDGRQLASGQADGTAKIWDILTGKCLRTLKGHTGTVRGVAFDGTGHRLATASEDGTAKLWDLSTGMSTISLKANKSKVTSVAFSPDDQTLVVAGDDNTARLYDPNTGRLRHILKGHVLPIVFVAFSPDGQTLATAGFDKTVKLWDVTTGKEIGALTAHSREVRCVRFSPDGKSIATASNDNTAMIWDVQTRKPTHTLPGHMSLVHGVSWTPDGKQLATCGFDFKVKVWDIQDSREKLNLNGHMGSVWALTFTPDGSSLITCSEDGTIKIWRGASQTEIASTVGTEAEP